MTTTHLQLVAPAVLLGVLLLATAVRMLPQARANRRHLAEARAAYARALAATHNQKDY